MWEIGRGFLSTAGLQCRAATRGSGAAACSSSSHVPLLSLDHPCLHSPLSSLFDTLGIHLTYPHLFHLSLSSSATMATTLQLFHSVFHSSSLVPDHNQLPNASSSVLRNGTPCILRASPIVSCSASNSDSTASVSRRQLSVASLIISTFGAVGAAFADVDEDYKRETGDVIEQVRATLALEKTDPNKAAAVAKLRQAGNEWVAKYRKSKKVAGKPSFSNMYSVINAISGHFVSFGATYPIPAKRKDRILDEVKDAERALNRGR